MEGKGHCIFFQLKLYNICLFLFFSQFFNAILGMNPREGSEPAFNLMRQREIFRTHLADLTFDSSNRVLLALWGDNFVTCLKLDGSSSAVETLEPSCAARLGASVLISALGLSVDHIMVSLLNH